RTRRHRKQDTQQKGPHASSVGDSINEVVDSIGLPGLQSCLASLALEVIVGAWPRLSEPEREVLQQQISRNRRESLETALQVREEDFGDGRRQEALLIEHLLRAARLEV
ncbi:MAG: hypothetical protein KDB07_07885, partial [Planctomycetes bacterium]|nr:hypothetical protein [Planctomycetota bacterium]